MKHPLFSLILVFVAFFILSAIFLYFFIPQNTSMAELEIKGIVIPSDIAETAIERARGLSGRAGLEKNSGMLFLFDTLDRHTMWMKDMRFPIDIVWIRNSHIVDLAEYARPESSLSDAMLTRYSPDVPAELVLELPAGFVKEHSILIGDEVFLRSGELPQKYKAFLTSK
jgi:hypothetical protein